jgi:asparagine synthase (glutamine-hydrolysing)
MSIAGSFIKSGDSRLSSVDHALASLTASPSFRRWHCAPVDLGAGNDASLAHTSPEQGENNLAITVWGRIDNRTILARELPASTALPDSDASLLLCAYRKWGIDFLDRVVGDFCCAIWDGSRDSLLLARDFAGRRPLVYHETSDTLYFAAEPRALLSLPGFPVEIDEDALAEWLVRLPRSHGKTFYRNISQVPPGHALIADRNGSRLHRYWRPEEQPMLHLRRDEEYAEALLAALEEAVSCRLPAEGSVACALSAGLDSPSVAALAARQLAKQGRRLTAITAVPQAGFDAAGRYPGRLCDEGALAASVARMYPNIDHVLIPNNSTPLLAAIETGIRVNNSPLLGANNLTWFNAMFEVAQDRNASAFLVGQAGNATISYHGMELLPSLLAQGRLLPLARELRQLRRSGSSRSNLAMQTLGPFLPPLLRQAVRAAFGKESVDSVYDLSCINPRFARASGVEECQHAFERSLAGNTDRGNVQRLMVQRLNSGMATAGTWRRHGFYPSDPTADKRVVELCLATPAEQYLRNGEPRSLVRRAMAGILPPELLTNRRIGLQSADWAMTWKTQLPEMRAELDRLETSALAQRYLDLPRMRMMLDKLPGLDWGRNEARRNCFVLARSFTAGAFIRWVESGVE